jgi:hypothetical protein
MDYSRFGAANPGLRPGPFSAVPCGTGRLYSCTQDSRPGLLSAVPPGLNLESVVYPHPQTLKPRRYILSGHQTNGTVSLGASAAGNYRQSADKNLEVEPDTPVLDIGRIEGDVAVKRGVLPRLYLPQSRHAGKHVEAPQMA